jgi:hypothetical protein
VANPIIANRAPADGTVAGVSEAARFSARASDLEIVRNTLFFYIGSGPAFYRASDGLLPEFEPDIDFFLKAWSGSPIDTPTIELVGNRLSIEKQVATNRRGLYEFGGLQSPADPDDPLMLEFTMSADGALVTEDGDDWSGILAGFKINDTGVVVKFLTDGVTPKVELQFAAVSTVAPPSGVYSANFAWEDNADHTYKLLWFPAQDLARLYVSSGTGPTPDTLLIDGLATDFPGPLAPNEIPTIQPVAFFGHGGVTAQATALWKDVYFYNIVSAPVRDGIYQGEHVGFIRTDNVIDYRPTKRPLNADQPWVLLPASFGTIAGGDVVTANGKLLVNRSDVSASYGFSRFEPKTALPATILDFKIAGELSSRSPGIGEATGMEVYIDDGVKKAVFALIDDGGVQNVGLLVGASPELASSYLLKPSNWVNEFSYRIIFDPTGSVDLVRIVQGDEGVEEEDVVSSLYSALPASDLPGPGLGFLHNGNTIAARATMKMGRIRYSTGVRTLSGDALPGSPWAQIGTGGIPESDGTFLKLPHTDTGDILYFEHPEATLDLENGVLAEFRARVNSYEVNGLTDPVREVTGVGATVDDGTFQHFLFFAEGGPQIGKIIVLATNDDIVENLLDIRAGTPATVGTYAQVDWTQFHMYRLEKTIGGQLHLYIDDSDTPSLSFEQVDFALPPTAGAPKAFRFGSFLDDRKSESEWEFFRHNLSAGFDVSGFPVLSENEVLSRFNHAVNVIAHAEEIL